MYENLDYEQLKGMSDEEKKEVLVKMLEEYKDPKTVAGQIKNAPFIAISNLIRRFVEGKPVGRQAGSKNKTIKQSETASNVIPQPGEQTNAVVVDIKQPKIRNPKVETKDQDNIAVKSQNTFTLSLTKGEVMGSELKVSLIGFGNILLDDKKYKTTVVIEEI
jgi:hypothetical protein